jgi:hypothetical protein
MKKSNKLECYIHNTEKSLQGQTLYLIMPILKLRRKYLLWTWPQGAYSQHFILFVTYEAVE